MHNFIYFLADVATQACTPTSRTNEFTKGIKLPFACAGSNEVQRVLQIISGLLGAIALLIITINALRYVLSQGDSTKTAKAKNGILYALVGLVVCISAYAIVTYAIFNITG